MKLRLLLLCSLLGGCSTPATPLVWLTPSEQGTVSGTVELRAQALGEPAPTNVVFLAGDTAVAKAYEEDGVYNAVWDSRGAAGQVVLSAKPYAGKAVTRAVTVAQTREE